VIFSTSISSLTLYSLPGTARIPACDAFWGRTHPCVRSFKVYQADCFNVISETQNPKPVPTAHQFGVPALAGSFPTGAAVLSGAMVLKVQYKHKRPR
jgi:hypothetical protein